MKEEKEVLEHFAGVFTMMNPLTFKEIFQTTVPYMVERISKNYALQVWHCLGEKAFDLLGELKFKILRILKYIIWH